MIRIAKITSVSTILCFFLGFVMLPLPVCPGEENPPAICTSDSGQKAENTVRASIEKPGDTSAKKKFPWLLAGLGAAAVVVAVVLLTSNKKESPTDGADVEYGTVTDIDGNVYRTVKIGNQEWMAENLKTTKYRNGDPIPNVTNDAIWSNLTSGSYSYYDNDPGQATIYGMLYNWYAVNDSRGMVPAGWHVPTDAEWAELVAYLGGASVAGGKLKEAGTVHWSSPNAGATNETGFTALPGGKRCPDGPYNYIGDIGFWWTATLKDSGKAWRLCLGYIDAGVDRDSYYLTGGFSVRCVKD